MQHFSYRPLPKKNKTHPAVLVAISLIPPLLGASSIGYKVYSQWDTETKQANATIAQQQERQQQIPSVVEKHYPVIQKPAPLPDYATLAHEMSVAQNDTPEDVFSDDVAAATRQSQSGSNSKEYVESNQNLGLDALDLSELSPELAEIVKSALDGNSALDDGSNNEEEKRTNEEKEYSKGNESMNTYHLVEHQGRFSGKLPAMNLQSHIYASDAEYRQVKINGQQLSEGDWLGEQIQLLEIAPRSITVRFNDAKIIIPDLYEWQG